MRRLPRPLALVLLATAFAAAPAIAQRGLRLGLSTGPDALAALAGRLELGRTAALRATLFHARDTEQQSFSERVRDERGRDVGQTFRTGGSLALLHLEPVSGGLRAHLGAVVTAHRTLDRTRPAAYLPVARGRLPANAYAYRTAVSDLGRIGAVLGVEAPLGARFHLHAEGEVGLEAVRTSRPGPLYSLAATPPLPPDGDLPPLTFGPRVTTTRLDALVPGISVGVAYRLR